MGTLNAATGVGWGIIMIPVLFLIPALTPQQAVAVSLLAYLFNSLVASFENVRSGLIVWRYAVYLSAGAIVGGVSGRICSRTSRPSRSRESWACW